MDADRGQALKATAAKKFENDFGLKVTIEDPEEIIDSFPIAAQMAKGSDIVIWAHDKVGEWADAGLIAPVEISEVVELKRETDSRAEPAQPEKSHRSASMKLGATQGKLR